MVRSFELISAAAVVLMRGTSAFAPISSVHVCAHSLSRTPESRLRAVADSSVIERPAEIREATDRKSDTIDEMLPEERWHLILHNDKQNTKEWVAHALHFVVGLSEERAYHVMQAAHENGKAFVGTYHYDVAECYQRGMGKNGIMCDVIPAEGFQ
eukprot:CCRYP_007057-RA/>CCRYP_007057-RA protein AED:0.25 eAED:-0.43 QI:0/-1/0/1/-1/1/1/0/154